MIPTYSVNPANIAHAQLATTPRWSRSVPLVWYLPEMTKSLRYNCNKRTKEALTEKSLNRCPGACIAVVTAVGSTAGGTRIVTMVSVVDDSVVGHSVMVFANSICLVIALSTDGRIDGIGVRMSGEGICAALSDVSVVCV